MIPNPILKVLSSIQKHQLQALLMGGQACVLYGAAEFSRDTDLAILGSPSNLEKLQGVLRELNAHQIAVPPLEEEYLSKGHAIHFRCGAEEVKGLRLDIMEKMRGVEDFPKLWERRTTIQLPDGIRVEVLSLPDLVQAKKTQRDKDWPMIRRLLEVNYFSYRDNATLEQIEFWLREIRTADLLLEVCKRWPEIAERHTYRNAVAAALSGDLEKVNADFESEEQSEREQDRQYWAPLKSELERLRHQKLK